MNFSLSESKVQDFHKYGHSKAFLVLFNKCPYLFEFKSLVIKKYGSDI